ncbi:MAG: S-layer homology domain-containing protein [Oscillospiraceae bacterium]|nr:S-layer homology domain-containing protein [Oscillospiraceae bacterium]
MRHKRICRILPLLLILSILLAGTASASVLGTAIDGTEQDVLRTVQLARGVYWTGSDYRSENYIEYTPNESVVPMVVYGSKVCNYGRFGTMTAPLEQQGYHVIAGVNGDYYNTSDYQPLGIVVSDGILRSSDGGNWAVGFYDDGKAVIGRPSLYISVETPGTAFYGVTLNKTRTVNTLALFTSDFSSTTKNVRPGYDVILIPQDEAYFTTNCTRTFTVGWVEEAGGARSLEAGQVIMSINAASDEAMVAAVQALQPGDEVTINIQCAPGWEDVQYAAGSLYKLVTDGVVESGLDGTAAPRTAVGLKPDGTLVLYTIDGRQTGLSVGASMTQVAQRLTELGCTEATVMDGGGSTSINVVLPGDTAASQINSPSDGSQRAVTEYIVLATKERATGQAERLALYPRSLHLLAGASQVLTVKAVDENGYPAQIASLPQYSVSEGVGTASAGEFHAIAAGTGTVTVIADGVESDSVPVTVVETPDQIQIRNRGIAFTRLVLEVGQRVDLSATAMFNHLNLTCQDTCYTWTATGGVGTITPEGVFTAADKKASGTISASAGGRTATVTVEIIYPEGYWDNPFTDVKEGDWFYESVQYVCMENLFKGMTETTFAPNTPLSRAMVATLLYRMAGEPDTAGLANSFKDVAADAWYARAVTWAEDVGVVTGVAPGAFSPDTSVTREQLVTMLDRYREAMGGRPSELDPAVYARQFTDWNKVSDWAESSMAWAVDAGIIQGDENGAVLPGGSATRAQAAAILQRYLDL